MSHAPASSSVQSSSCPLRATSARLAGLLAAVALVAGCGGGGGGGDDGGGGATPPPPPPPAAEACQTPAQTPGAITIFGVAQFESVPPDRSGIGLDYAGTIRKPIRGATAELLDAAGRSLAACVTSASGNFAFTLPFTSITGDVRVRVRAEMRKTSPGGGQWDFSVRDNTGGDALYVLDAPPFTPAQTDIPQDREVLAASGFDGTAYTGVRAAGPFAILDVVFDATQKVLGASPDPNFPLLKLFWSPNNTTNDGDISAGSIGTSFYSFSDFFGHEIFLLGEQDVDTDEYDRHVIAHEWGHYLQAAFSRDDSPGGDHVAGDRLDMRVAFSEGWGNGWAGIALNKSLYTDSLGDRQSLGFSFDVAQSPVGMDRGWYSESSVQFLMWSFSQDGDIGFRPMFNVLSGPLKTSDSFTGIHNFATLLKAAAPGGVNDINALLQGQNISAVDALGTNETNNGNIAQALPIYRPAAGQHCVSDAAGVDNKLGNQVFIRFNASGSRRLTLSSVGGQAGSDPNFVLTLSNGTQLRSEKQELDSERADVNLPAGNHTLELFDAELLSGVVTGIRCFNFSIQ
jgi:hypothetical protein